MGRIRLNDIRLCFRNSLDRCDGIITGGLDCCFRFRCIDVIFAGVHCICQSLNAGCIVFALLAGIERSFDDRDSRLFQLGNRFIVERFNLRWYSFLETILMEKVTVLPSSAFFGIW